MGRVSDIQNTVNAGELSPLILGRQDIGKYKGGLFVCFNGVPLAQGAWTRRPGTLFLNTSRDSGSRKGLLVPFQYSVTQTYQLEFAQNFVRFWTLHGLVTQTARNITAATKADPCQITAAAHGYTNGDRVFVQGVLGMTQLNNREYTATVVDGNSFTVGVNSTAYDTYTSGGTVAKIVDLASPYQEADLPSLRYTQSADTIYLFHPNYAPRKLTRLTTTSFSMTTISFLDGPYLTTNGTTTTLTPSAATGAGVTVTASAITGINNNTGFQTTDVGRLIRMKEGATWGYAQITSRTNTTVVIVTVINTLTNTAAKTLWRLGRFSDTTGYPTSGTFHEDRLMMGGVSVTPQAIDASKSGDYENFAPTATDGTVAADNALSISLNSADVNAIYWLASDEKGLLVGTGGGEWIVRASSLGEAMTPTNIVAKSSTKFGSFPAAPVRAGKATLFIQRAARKLRELAYVFEIDGFKAPDMSILSEHITRPSLVQLAYQTQSQSIVWATRSDGVLLSLTYERDQDVVAWASHELGGVGPTGSSIPIVESISVIPSPDASRDECWMIVKRKINGVDVRHVEVITKFWESTDVQETAFYSDCGWTVVDAAGTTSVTGLFFLEGATVQVYADGAVHPPQIVTNGKITLQYIGHIITLGYSYNSDGQTMPSAANGQDGSGQGKLKRVNRVGFWLLDTLGLAYGRDASHLTELLVRPFGGTTQFGVATPLVTGVFRERFEGVDDRLAQVYWRAKGPFPANVLASMSQLTLSDDT